MASGYPDTWLRGLRVEFALGLALFVFCVSDALTHAWLSFWIVAVCLVFSATMNVLNWRMRGAVIQAEKAKKNMPIVGPSFIPMPPGGLGAGGGGMSPMSLGTGGAGGGGLGGYASVSSAQMRPAMMSAATTPGPGVVTGNRLPRHKDYPNTFGWRAWRWDAEVKLLHSPAQGTPWRGSELRVEFWEEQAVVRGCAGIHAEFVPEGWETRVSDYAHFAGGPVVLPSPNMIGQREINAVILGVPLRFVAIGDDRWQDVSTGRVYPVGMPISIPGASTAIHGIVERYGKFVMGTEGWRAEWVVIRKLLAPDTETGLALEQAYPDVEVIYPKEKPDGYR